MFVFLNGRCVEHKGLSRLITRCFRLHAAPSNGDAGGTAKRYPFVVLNVTCPHNAFDLNLSPDKRDVLLKHKQHFEDAIKQALIPNELDKVMTTLTRWPPAPRI